MHFHLHKALYPHKHRHHDQTALKLGWLFHLTMKRLVAKKDKIHLPETLHRVLFLLLATFGRMVSLEYHITELFVLRHLVQRPNERSDRIRPSGYKATDRKSTRLNSSH